MSFFEARERYERAENRPSVIVAEVWFFFNREELAIIVMEEHGFRRTEVSIADGDN